MTFKQILLTLLVLVLFAVLFGYFATKATPVTPPVSEVTHVLSGVATSSNRMVHVEDAAAYHIEVTYPAAVMVGDVAANAKAQATLETALAKQIADFKSDSGLDSLTAHDIEVQGIGGDRRYALTVDYKEYKGASSASYLFTVYADTLGAHPNTYYLTEAFDTTGNTLGITDVVGANGLAKLSQLVTADVAAELKDRTGEDDVSGIMFAEGAAPKAENFQNFVIDGSDLLIELPPYQVAAYAAGSFEVKIPLSAVAK